MPKISLTTTEISSSSGVPTATGVTFVAGVCDQGPTPGGPAYVLCESLQQYISVFGARSATSALLYDFLDELFHDGGPAAAAYVTRVTDSTATTASLTLNDGLASPEPTILVTAATSGAGGNLLNIVVTAGTGTKFTATRTSASNTLTAVSSFAFVGVGTPITGTGIPANTYVTAVNTGAATITLNNAATAAGSTQLTPGTVTVQVQDQAGDILDSHGPYYLTSQLIADTTSTYVTFTQSTASGNTVNLPAALAATGLSGGADATDITDASHVAALANFPKWLGPGQVALPGRTSATAWEGLDAHAIANNRWSIKDMIDQTTSAAVVAQVATNESAGWGLSTYGMLIQGSLVLPPIAPGTTPRTAAGSAAIAALRAQVAATKNQNTAPAGINWGLNYPLGFTTSYGPAGASAAPAGTFLDADVATMEAGGVNCFANLWGTLCLYGFVTPVSPTVDPEFWQASSAVERMNLNAKGTQILAKYLFDGVDQPTLTALNGDLSALGLAEYDAKALYGDDGSGNDLAANAFTVLTGPPVNTPATAEAGALNAVLQVRLTKYADTVSLAIQVVPLTQSVATGS